MKFIIKTTGIADRLSVLVSSPQSGGGGLTVGTARPFPSGRRLKIRVSEGEGGGRIKTRQDLLTSLLLGLIRGLFCPFIL